MAEEVVQYPTVKGLYKLGKEFCTTSTVYNDFMPFIALNEGPRIMGKLANSNEDIADYLDFSSGYSCNPLGYNNSVIRRAITEYLDTFGFVQFPFNDWYHETGIMLCKKLCEMAPMQGKKKVFLSNSGAEAVEAAMKMCQARRHSFFKERQRPMFMAFQDAFHGRTAGALSLHGSKEIHRSGFERSHKTHHLPFPEVNNQENIGHFYHSLKIWSAPYRINAFFIELVQGEGGIRVIDKDSLLYLVDYCRENDIYIIVDEVQTGLMRTGKMFACEHYGIDPDIICMAKALGGGLPLGATIAKEEFDFKPGQHSNTNGGNPLICAVSLAIIEELENLYLELPPKIKLLKEFAPNGLGLMRRINLITSERRDEVVKKALENKLILIGAGENAIRLMPPINISLEDLEAGLNILNSSLN